MFAAVQESHHRGIPIRWADLPGPVTGTLIFGVGHRDEPAHLLGITHLIEHLAFRTTEPIHVQHCGVVSDESLMFYATGEPRDVALFLNDIARALATMGEVSSHDLALEKSIIRTEAGGTYTSAGLLTYRYGLGGLGNANAHHAGGYTFSAAELAQWSDIWLTRANAALTFTGPIPPELNIDLPHGVRPDRWSGKPIVTTPRLVRSGKAGVAISLLAPATSAFELGEALRFEFTYQLRHALGLVYSPTVFHTRVDEENTQVDLILDPNSEHVLRVVEEASALMKRIVADGFSNRAVAATRTDWLTALAWTNAEVAQYLDASSAADLLGFSSPTPELSLIRAEALTHERLSAAIRTSMESLILAYDEDVDLDEHWIEASGLTHDRREVWITDQVLLKRRGRRWHGKPRSDASRATATIHDGLLTLKRKGSLHSIRFSDLVVIGSHECGCLQLIDLHGRNLTIDPGDWYRGKSLVVAIIARVEPQIVRSFPPH